MNIYLVIVQVLAWLAYGIWVRRTDSRLSKLWAKKLQADRGNVIEGILHCILKYDLKYDVVSEKYELLGCGKKLSYLKFKDLINGRCYFNDKELEGISVSLGFIAGEIRADEEEQEDDGKF